VGRALQPLIDQGLVHLVQAGLSIPDGGVPHPSRHELITVLVSADDPEAHRVDIMKLVLQAGLKVELHLQPSPSRSRG
jgi:hypothetical protein